MKNNNQGTLFKTLWAIVMKQLNKSCEYALRAQLEKIIKYSGVKPVYPYKPLPNVREFKVTITSPYDPILLASGIKKRLYEAEKESTPYRNRSMNRYVRYQFDRLNKNRHNPKIFWSIATHLLFHSHAYRVICFNHVFPNWHRKYKYSVVKNILASLDKLSLNKYRYKTVMIPKGNGETRPLGVPAPAWRVLLHGLNNVLVVWLSPYTHPSQHGFLPGRGTLTAWSQLLKKTQARSIHEFDMSKFFDSVNLHYLKKILEISGIPTVIVNYIIKWNQTLPSNRLRHGITWKSPLEEASDFKYMHTSRTLNGFSDYTYWINRKRSEELEKPELRNYEYFRGVSQGMPISPLLASLILAPNLASPNVSLLLYADDGIMFSEENTINLPILPPESGISFNYSKSKIVKSHGK